MTPPSPRPRYTLIPRPEATEDILALAVHGPDVVAAAVAITDDLAHGRVDEVTREILAIGPRDHMPSTDWPPAVSRRSAAAQVERSRVASVS